MANVDLLSVNQTMIAKFKETFERLEAIEEQFQKDKEEKFVMEIFVKLVQLFIIQNKDDSNFDCFLNFFENTICNIDMDSFYNVMLNNTLNNNGKIIYIKDKFFKFTFETFTFDDLVKKIQLNTDSYNSNILYDSLTDYLTNCQNKLTTLKYFKEEAQICFDILNSHK